MTSDEQVPAQTNLRIRWGRDIVAAALGGLIAVGIGMCLAVLVPIPVLGWNVALLAFGSLTLASILVEHWDEDIRGRLDQEERRQQDESDAQANRVVERRGRSAWVPGWWPKKPNEQSREPQGPRRDRLSEIRDIRRHNARIMYRVKFAAFVSAALALATSGGSVTTSFCNDADFVCTSELLVDGS